MHVLNEPEIASSAAQRINKMEIQMEGVIKTIKYFLNYLGFYP
jgi:hypothetical protein